MKLGLNLKIKKNTEDVGHRRTRTDYANPKKLVDNYFKPNLPESSIKPIKCVYLGMQVKQKSMNTKYTHSRANNKSLYGQNHVATEHYEKPATTRKNQTCRPHVDLCFKKVAKNNSDAKQNMAVRPLQIPLKGADRYEWDRQVGAGTFGTVHKARDKKTLQIVAIKKVFQDPKYKNRQLEILKMLKHPNVLQIKQHFITYEGDKEYLNVVMDYYPTNLYDYIQQSKTKRMSKLKYKVIAFQLFRGLLYLKQKSIAHRDVKPHNILFKEEGLKALICDFGSAKILVPGDQNISYICSRCYRAPELIFDNSSYSTQIDVWSMGCVLIQMVTGTPIFRASSNAQQLIQIIKVLGTPTPEQIVKMNPKCRSDDFHLPKVPKKDWVKVLKTHALGDQFLDLLNGIMKYSPTQRFTPFDILNHKFFDQLRLESIYKHLRKQLDIPQLFNFAEQFKSCKFNDLVPDWWSSSSPSYF